MRASPFPGPRIAPSDEWEMYGVELELGDWRYHVDEGGLLYGPGLYPFHWPVTRTEPNPAAPLLSHQVPTGRTRPTGVRLSPNVANYSWGNEYVLLEPFDHRVLLRTRLFAGREGAKVMVRRIEIELDLHQQRVVLLSSCPAGLIEQATTKAERTMGLLRTACGERDRGASRPVAVLSGVFRAAIDGGPEAESEEAGRA